LPDANTASPLENAVIAFFVELGLELEGWGRSGDAPPSEDAAGEQCPEHEQRLEEQAPSPTNMRPQPIQVAFGSFSAH